MGKFVRIHLSFTTSNMEIRDNLVSNSLSVNTKFADHAAMTVRYQILPNLTPSYQLYGYIDEPNCQAIVLYLNDGVTVEDLRTEIALKLKTNDIVIDEGIEGNTVQSFSGAYESFFLSLHKLLAGIQEDLSRRILGFRALFFQLYACQHPDNDHLIAIEWEKFAVSTWNAVLDHIDSLKSTKSGMTLPFIYPEVNFVSRTCEIVQTTSANKNDVYYEYTFTIHLPHEVDAEAQLKMISVPVIEVMKKLGSEISMSSVAVDAENPKKGKIIVRLLGKVPTKNTRFDDDVRQTLGYSFLSRFVTLVSITVCNQPLPAHCSESSADFKKRAQGFIEYVGNTIALEQIPEAEINNTNYPYVAYKLDQSYEQFTGDVAKYLSDEFGSIDTTNNLSFGKRLLRGNAFPSDEARLSWMMVMAGQQSHDDAKTLQLDDNFLREVRSFKNPRSSALHVATAVACGLCYFTSIPKSKFEKQDLIRLTFLIDQLISITDVIDERVKAQLTLALFAVGRNVVANDEDKKKLCFDKIERLTQTLNPGSVEYCYILAALLDCPADLNEETATRLSQSLAKIDEHKLMLLHQAHVPSIVFSSDRFLYSSRIRLSHQRFLKMARSLLILGVNNRKAPGALTLIQRISHIINRSSNEALPIEYYKLLVASLATITDDTVIAATHAVIDEVLKFERSVGVVTKEEDIDMLRIVLSHLLKNPHVTMLISHVEQVEKILALYELPETSANQLGAVAVLGRRYPLFSRVGFTSAYLPAEVAQLITQPAAVFPDNAQLSYQSSRFRGNIAYAATFFLFGSQKKLHERVIEQIKTRGLVNRFNDATTQAHLLALQVRPYEIAENDYHHMDAFGLTPMLILVCLSPDDKNILPAIAQPDLIAALTNPSCDENRVAVRCIFSFLTHLKNWEDYAERYIKTEEKLKQYPLEDDWEALVMRVLLSIVMNANLFEKNNNINPSTIAANVEKLTREQLNALFKVVSLDDERIEWIRTLIPTLSEISVSRLAFINTAHCVLIELMSPQHQLRYLDTHLQLSMRLATVIKRDRKQRAATMMTFLTQYFGLLPASVTRQVESVEIVSAVRFVTSYYADFPERQGELDALYDQAILRFSSIIKTLQNPFDYLNLRIQRIESNISRDGFHYETELAAINDVSQRLTAYKLPHGLNTTFVDLISGVRGKLLARRNKDKNETKQGKKSRAPVFTTKRDVQVATLSAPESQSSTRSSDETDMIKLLKIYVFHKQSCEYQSSTHQITITVKDSLILTSETISRLSRLGLDKVEQTDKSVKFRLLPPLEFDPMGWRTHFPDAEEKPKPAEVVEADTRATVNKASEATAQTTTEPAVVIDENPFAGLKNEELLRRVIAQFLNCSLDKVAKGWTNELPLPASDKRSESIFRFAITNSGSGVNIREKNQLNPERVMNFFIAAFAKVDAIGEFHPQIPAKRIPDVFVIKRSKLIEALESPSAFAAAATEFANNFATMQTVQQRVYSQTRPNIIFNGIEKRDSEQKEKITFRSWRAALERNDKDSIYDDGIRFHLSLVISAMSALNKATDKTQLYRLYAFHGFFVINLFSLREFRANSHLAPHLDSLRNAFRHTIQKMNFESLVQQTTALFTALNEVLTIPNIKQLVTSTDSIDNSLRYFDGVIESMTLSSEIDQARIDSEYAHLEELLAQPTTPDNLCDIALTCWLIHKAKQDAYYGDQIGKCIGALSGFVGHPVNEMRKANLNASYTDFEDALVKRVSLLSEQYEATKQTATNSK